MFGNIIGDWSNGMIGVSKTFGGSSILSSPVKKRRNTAFFSYSRYDRTQGRTQIKRAFSYYIR